MHAEVGQPPQVPGCRRPRRHERCLAAVPAPFRLQYILALKGCHKDNPIAKFWGVCNQAAIDLNLCLKEEKVVKRCAKL